MIRIVYVEDDDDNVYMLKMVSSLLGPLRGASGRNRQMATLATATTDTT